MGVRVGETTRGEPGRTRAIECCDALLPRLEGNVRRWLRRFAGVNSGHASKHLRELAQFARRPDQPVLG